MMQLEVGGRSVPIAAGHTIVGSGPDCTVCLTGAGVRPSHLLVDGLPDGTVAVRAAGADTPVLLNGVQLGVDPTPVLHGDKLDVAGHELLVVDSGRVGNTRMLDASALASLSAGPATPRSQRPIATSGGRLLSLSDGREYLVGSEPLTVGREAGCDVVVSGDQASRQHATIEASADGYRLTDTSVNGTWVNGQRLEGSRLLRRGDQIRIGRDEFRFSADPGSPEPPPPAPAPGPAPVPPPGAGARLGDTMMGMPAARPVPPVARPASEAPVLASLVVRSGALKGQRLSVRAPVANLGRGDYNDLVLPDSSVSGSHAKLQRRDGVWIVADLGSTNGTEVDGEPVAGETALGPGATVKFGEVSVLFEPLDQGMEGVGGTRSMARIATAPEPPAAQAAPEPDLIPVPRSGPQRPMVRRPAPEARPGSWWMLWAGLVVVAAAIAAYLLLS